MAIISKEEKRQVELNGIYESILTLRESIQTELKLIRIDFDKICNQHIFNGLDLNENIVAMYNEHHNKFVEYDIYCHLIDILNDFKDLYGYFPEYNEMYSTLESMMFHFADQEKYEVAAILKIWVDKINSTIE